MLTGEAGLHPPTVSTYAQLDLITYAYTITTQSTHEFGVTRIQKTMSDIENFLSDYPDSIGNLGMEICNLISRNAIGAEPRVQPGWKVVAFEYGRGFCAVAPHKKWVNIQFYAGTDLPDPSNLLEGTGKSMRHIKIRASDELDGSVVSLIKAAAKLAQQ